MGLEHVARFELPSYGRGSGVLTVIEDLPFPIQRAFLISGVPEGESRGGHANRDMHVFVAAAGSFDLLLDDGSRSATWHLDRAGEGVYVPPLIWRELRNFSYNATCLVFSNRPYSPDDYIRDYRQFCAEVLEAATGTEAGSGIGQTGSTR